MERSLPPLGPIEQQRYASQIVNLAPLSKRPKRSNDAAPVPDAVPSGPGAPIPDAVPSGPGAPSSDAVPSGPGAEFAELSDAAPSSDAVPIPAFADAAADAAPTWFVRKASKNGGDVYRVMDKIGRQATQVTVRRYKKDAEPLARALCAQVNAGSIDLNDKAASVSSNINGY